MSKSIFYWLEEPVEYKEQFRCEDFDVLETAMEIISQERNIRYGHRQWRCGWIIRDFTGGDYEITARVNQILALQFIDGIEL